MKFGEAYENTFKHKQNRWQKLRIKKKLNVTFDYNVKDFISSKIKIICINKLIQNILFYKMKTFRINYANVTYCSKK